MKGEVVNEVLEWLKEKRRGSFWIYKSTLTENWYLDVWGVRLEVEDLKRIIAIAEKHKVDVMILENEVIGCEENRMVVRFWLVR